MLAPMACTPLHAEGPCETLHLSQDGRYLLSAGADGRIAGVDAAPVENGPALRSWRTRLVPASAVLTTVAVSADRAWVAKGEENDQGFGVYYNALDPQTAQPKGVPKLVARFTLPVREVQWHPTLPLLAVAADDGKLLVYDRSAESGEAKRPRRKDFQTSGGGAVRCVAMDPRGELLAAALASGALAIFKLSDASEQFRAAAWPKAVIGSQRLGIEWSPDGSALALPGEPGLRVALREELTSARAAPGSIARKLSATGPPLPSSIATLVGGHRQATTTAAWAPNGEFVASASCEAVALWRWPSAPGASPARIWRLDSAPESLTWGSSAFLAAGTVSGGWARFEVPSLAELKAEEKAAKAAAAAAAAAAAGLDAEKAAASVLEGTPTKTPQASPAKGSPAKAGADEDENAPAKKKARPSPVIQLPFQPGATGSPKKRRYLAWNEYGRLRFLPPTKKGLDGKVSVEYSRERGRSSVREIKTPLGLTHGALGPGLLALASEATGKTPAGISVHLATPWVKTSFDHTLPEGEQIEALAAGRRFVAAFTSPLRQLRIHSLSGIPLGALSLSGPVVCLAAYEDLLLCITQAPGAPPAEPVLEYALYGVSLKERLAVGTVPLSSASTLRWVGFSAEALPLALDSKGVLRCLALSGCGPPVLAPAAGEWLPVAELENSGRRLWPVRAEAGSLSCVELAADGEEPHVGAASRLREVQYRLPVGAGVEGVEKALRLNLLASHLNFAQDAGLLKEQKAQQKGAPRGAPSKDDIGMEKKEALRLFSDYSKRGLLEEALDVACNLFGVRTGLEHQELRLLAEARKLSSKAGQDELTGRVARLHEEASEREAKKLKKDDEEDDDDDEAEAESDDAEGSEEEEEAGEGDAVQEEGAEEGEQPRMALPSLAQGLRRPREEDGDGNEEPAAQRLRT